MPKIDPRPFYTAISSRIFSINAAFLFAYVLCSIIPTEPGFFHAFDAIKSIITLAITLPLFGANLTFIIERLTEQEFDFFEYASIATIIGIILHPFILTIEYTQFGFLSKNTPLINAMIVLFMAFIYSIFKPLRKQEKIKNFPKEITAPFVIAVISHLTLIILFISAYYSLGESDPYYWLLKIQGELDAHTVATIHSYRPLLSSLAYIFHVSANIDLYAFFKYILPFFTALVIFPTALLAQKFTERSHQAALFAIPFASASSIIYFQLPIPQAIMNICTVFFIFFLLYSWLSKKDTFYFAAGITIFGAYFYHEVSSLLFVIWLIVTIIYYHSQIIKYIRSEKLVSFLTVIILFYNISFISFIFTFIADWITRVQPSALAWHVNFSFPMQYINIDGHSVGWENWFGVAKYYAFYAGPAVAALLIAIVIMAINPKSRNDLKMIWDKQRGKKEFFLLAMILLAFFAIAEILPRFTSIALLPDRAWNFVSLFSLAFAPILFRYSHAKTNLIAILIVATVFINTLAAIYVNSLKKNLITPEQIDSAEWIKHDLPQKKVVFTNNNWSVLKAHAQADIIEIKDPAFYSDTQIFENTLRTTLGLEGYHETNADYSESLTKITNISSQLKINEDHSSTQETLNKLSDIRILSTALTHLIQTDLSSKKDRDDRHVYIYYMKPNTNNLYADRPYFKKSTDETHPLFDNDRNRFKRVYSTSKDAIVIWEMIEK